jgi:ketosteroid isomerase-like protein
MGNVEVARRSFAAFNRSIAEGSDAFCDMVACDIEWIPFTSYLDGRTYRGREALRRWMTEVMQTWEAYEARWTEARDLGDGRVLAFGTWHARGPHGGVQLRFDHAAWLVEVEGGQLVRLQTFTDRCEAVNVAGLRD